MKDTPKVAPPIAEAELRERVRELESTLTLMREQCRVSDEAFNFHLKRANDLMTENERLKGELAESNHWRERHCSDAKAYGEQSQKNWEELTALRAENERLNGEVSELREKLNREIENSTADIAHRKQLPIVQDVIDGINSASSSQDFFPKSTKAS